MSLPAPPKRLSRYVGGKMVCYDHSLRICGICCVDFAYDDSDAEDDFGPDDEEDGDEYSGSDDSIVNSEEEEEDDDDESVFVLSGMLAKFVPQWDEQLLGPGNMFQIKKNYDNPPKPLPASSFETHSCGACQLTWLIGEIGKEDAESHPSHHTYQHLYAGTRRSLIVYTDGACRSNGKDAAHSGVGVFFGEGSKYNISERHITAAQPTNQAAELFAVARALETVRLKVIPDRLAHIMQAKGWYSPGVVRDVKGFRLIVTTDSSYLVDGMCSYIQDWTLNDAKDTFTNKKKKPIKNSEGFLRIQEEVKLLSLVGIQVVYHHVSREENKHADALANAAFNVLSNSTILKAL